MEINRMENLKNDFLSKAKIVHGDKWDYSKTSYVNRDTPITIICSIHGEFKQKPSNHLHSKYPCPKCVHPKCLSNPNSKRSFLKTRPKRIKIQPDEIINGIKFWVRQCPRCNTKLLHRGSWYRDDSIIKNKLCNSCKSKSIPESSIKRQNQRNSNICCWKNKINSIVITEYMDGKVYLNNHGYWSRKCSDCGYETEYSRVDNAIAAEKRNSKCGKCSLNLSVNKTSKVFDDVSGVFFNSSIKQWCRNCPMCGTEIKYTSKNWAVKAQKNETGCYSCYSESRISKPEQEFLDLFKITDRQKQIGKYMVDGLKNNTIYEFLGDFWHGNPSRYDMGKMNNASKKHFKNYTKKLFIDSKIYNQEDTTSNTSGSRIGTNSKKLSY